MCAFAGACLAQSAGGDFALTAYSIAGGGGQSTSQEFSAEVTVAQPLAAGGMSGGVYDVLAGFQQDDGVDDALFSDGFE
jgi:hypothetical protein